MSINTKQSDVIANGAIRQLEELLNRLSAERIFFVVDKPAFEYSGASKALESSLKNRTVIWFSDFELNPKLEDVEDGIELFRGVSADVVIVLGGGSALDMAKLIAGLGVQEGEPLSYITGERVMEKQCPPIIAIPTTAGTGSEATHFAVVYVYEIKYSLAHSMLLPEYALIDPELTYTLPPSTTAATGLDALSQTIESIWAVGATDESIGYALEALPLLLGNLEIAVNNPTPESRMAMTRAAHLAGKAINISKTTAPHALSYSITTNFNVPHGVAVALTLGSFLEYNYYVDRSNCIDPRGSDHVKRRINYIINMLGNGSLEHAQQKIITIMRNIHCPICLGEVGIKKDNISLIIDQVNVERMSNNPRRINSKDLSFMLELLL